MFSVRYVDLREGADLNKWPAYGGNPFFKTSHKKLNIPITPFSVAVKQAYKLCFFNARPYCEASFSTGANQMRR